MRLIHAFVPAVAAAAVGALIVGSALTDGDREEGAPAAATSSASEDAESTAPQSDAEPESAAESAAAADPSPAAPSAADDGVLSPGEARPDISVARLSDPPALGSGGSTKTAVETFIEGVIWALASDAARADPTMISEAMGGTLEASDAGMLEGMDRSPGVTLAAANGYYRIPGHSGPEDSPDQVMVEVSIPMTVGQDTHQLLAGGVVALGKDGRWHIMSMRPSDMNPTAETETDTTPGLGWNTIVPAPIS